MTYFPLFFGTYFAWRGYGAYFGIMSSVHSEFACQALMDMKVFDDLLKQRRRSRLVSRHVLFSRLNLFRLFCFLLTDSCCTTHFGSFKHPQPFLEQASLGKLCKNPGKIYERNLPVDLEMSFLARSLRSRFQGFENPAPLFSLSAAHFGTIRRLFSATKT
jgi:hypothetical protein